MIIFQRYLLTGNRFEKERKTSKDKFLNWLTDLMTFTGSRQIVLAGGQNDFPYSMS